MSFEHINYVRDHSETTGAARLLLLAIATRTDKEGVAYPGYECLARETAMSIRSIRRLLERDPADLKHGAPAIPADELEIIPGGSEKGGKRRPTQYRILIDQARPGEEKTMRRTRTVKGTTTNNDCAPDAHSKDNTDHAHTDTRPCASTHATVRLVPHDCAPDAHLTELNKEKNKKANTRARTCDSCTPNGSGRFKPDAEEKSFAVARKEEQKPNHSTPKKEKRAHHNENGIVVTPENIATIKLADRYLRLDVWALLPAAQKACAQKYPNGGPMRIGFFKEFLNRVQADLPPLGLIEAERVRAEILLEAGRHREEAKKLEPTAEQKRARFVFDLHRAFPEINVEDIASRYVRQCEDASASWDDEQFKSLVADAQEAFERLQREGEPRIPGAPPEPKPEEPEQHKERWKRKCSGIANEIELIFAELMASGSGWKPKTFDRRVGEAFDRHLRSNAGKTEN